jgi:hypothetical protein
LKTPEGGKLSRIYQFMGAERLVFEMRVKTQTTSIVEAILQHIYLLKKGKGKQKGNPPKKMW